MPKKKLFLGAHMSIEGGIQNAYYRGSQIGCTALQLFTHSNRQWGMKSLSLATIDAVHEAQKITGITHTAVHASYLINLASENPETAQKSREMLKKELEQCNQLNIPFLVLHPGSNKDEKLALQLIADYLNEIFQIDTGNTTLLLENTAGQGTQVGYRFEQLAEIEAQIHDKKRVGYCIDTCHLWAAGYDFSTHEGYHSVFDECEKILGLTKIKAFHVNDSKQKRESHVDRHEDIGKGTIGLEAFKLLMNDTRFAETAKILETPSKDLEAYAQNMKVLENLLD